MKSIIKELGEKFDGGAKKPLVESYDEKYDRSKMVNELANMEENLVAKPQHNLNPSSENVFAPVEQLQSEIREKDKIIENLKNESIELKNQVATVEQLKNKLKELENSRLVALSTKKVYEDRIKSIIDKTADNEQLQGQIRDKDKVIEGLTIGLTKLKNQISIAEKEKSTILEGLKKSKWLENKVTLVAKKLYEDKVQSIIDENVDSKIIPILIDVARKKQGNQQLNWGGWLQIPENKYLFQINENIAKKIFEDTNALVTMRIVEAQTAGGGDSPRSSLTFTGNTAASSTGDHVITGFNPNDYNLHLGFTISYWVRPDEVGTHMFAIGRKHNNNERFVFGISKSNKIYAGVGGNKLENTWTAMGATTLFPDLFDDGDLRLGNWLHFVITYADRSDTSANAARKTYLNGALIQEANINWNNIDGEFADDGIYFGARNLKHSGNLPGYNNGWACGLDEVAIYDTAKDSGWVANVYSGETDYNHTGENGLVGYWRFNAGSGTTVEDLSGNGNHGTFATEKAHGNVGVETTAAPTWSTDTP